VSRRRFAGDTELFPDNQIQIESEKIDATGLALNLTLRSVNMNDAGDYKAVATNVAGTATNSSKLTVKSKLTQNTK
jgi:hypothetical protein